ncbi:ATPase AAA [Vibrio tubiashii ATCC 19109]|uniref:ATPase AAA n=1 Tax=Vibrio tubiashii ATCC 19109 TaxID=1051646 RepID=F9SZX5_9VIBR|nr:KAP family NTPase [Vibrio tubiashii]AIW16294.1 ATPase AAA [Vibrio tubiashii ATCC 19109]EGU59053.1 hypothetical protein VITU9109_18905 [Vibrio tubiashii ATCC 19109]EIF05943.1 hypothetical protein VT1337_00845 [Vibrio tubiashii NCIMB 1337 = ATCC 19106]
MSFEKRDEFKRRNIAEKIIKILNSNISTSPLVIDGSWGLGKTEFCQKLIHLMSETEEHHLIYIDAFKADHADEPLLTVLAKVLEVIPDETEQKGIIQKSVPALRYGLKVGGKALVSHILRQDADHVLDGFENEIREVADKAIDTSVESLLKDHIEAEKNLKALQEALQDIAEKKRIFIFIDELDRCRPDFAVQMLETIKHTFDVEGVNFVLVTNLNQLKASINHRYGESIDAQRYLDKFLKFTVTIPNTTIEHDHHSTLASIRHYRALLESSELIKVADLAHDSDFKFVSQIIAINNLSLREVETFVRHVEIYQVLTNNHGLNNQVFWVYKKIRLLGILLASLKPDLANSALSNRLDAAALGEFVGVAQLPDWNDQLRHPTHLQVIAVMLGSECHINSESYIAQDQQERDKWDQEIGQYFKGIGWPPAKGERLKLLADVIQTINLAK